MTTHPYTVERSEYWDPRQKKRVPSQRFWALACRTCDYRFPRRGSGHRFIDGANREMYDRALRAYDDHIERADNGT